MCVLVLASLLTPAPAEDCGPALPPPFAASGRLRINTLNPVTLQDQFIVDYDVELVFTGVEAVYRVESVHGIEGFYTRFDGTRVDRVWLRLKQDVMPSFYLLGWGDNRRGITGYARSFLPYSSFVFDTQSPEGQRVPVPGGVRWDTRIRANEYGFSQVVWRCDEDGLLVEREWWIPTEHGDYVMAERFTFDDHDAHLIPWRIDVLDTEGHGAGSTVSWKANQVTPQVPVDAVREFIRTRLANVDELPRGSYYSARIARILLPGENAHEVVPREVDRRAENLANLLAGGQSRDLRRAVKSANTTANKHRRWQWMLGGAGAAILLAGLWLMARKR